jgi:hypothetical protein
MRDEAKENFNNFSSMSFRPAKRGEIPIVLHLLKIALAKDKFFPAKALLITTLKGFLGLWPRNDMRAEWLKFLVGVFDDR